MIHTTHTHTQTHRWYTSYGREQPLYSGLNTEALLGAFFQDRMEETADARKPILSAGILPNIPDQIKTTRLIQRELMQGDLYFRLLPVRVGDARLPGAVRPHGQ